LKECNRNVVNIVVLIAMSRLKTWNLKIKKKHVKYVFNIKKKVFSLRNKNPDWGINYSVHMYSSWMLDIFQDRHGRDRMVVGFLATRTYAICAYHPYRCEFESHSGEVYSIQHYVIKFVNNLRQVGGFLWVLWFPPPIKLTATI
jgi:hypothetical protein